jgi:lipid-binding SYLF domain-containing protein
MRSLVGLLLLALAACAAAPPTEEQKERQDLTCKETLERFKTADPTLGNVMADAAGWAVFPKIGEGAVGIGAGFGRGQVYSREKGLIGYATVSEASIGIQLGGQTYSQLILFRDEAALTRFTRGNFEFSAQLSAVAVKTGASKDASYSGGVIVLTMPRGGLMGEVSVGGQKFDYRAK